MQKGRKNWQSSQHPTTLSGYIFANKVCIDNRKNLLNSNISSTYPDNMVNFGALAAEICWRVWAHPANFNRFRVFASLLQRRRSPDAMPTKLGRLSRLLRWYTVTYIHFGGFAPNRIFPIAKFTLRPSLAFSCISSVTARHSSCGRQPNFVA